MSGMVGPGPLCCSDAGRGAVQGRIGGGDKGSGREHLDLVYVFAGRGWVLGWVVILSLAGT